MAVSLKHAFTSAKGDGADSTFVQPSNWNAEHTLTLDTDKLVGRQSAGNGAAEEIPCTSTGRSIIAAANAAAARTVLGLAAVAASGSFSDLGTTPTTLSGYGITDAAAKAQTFDDPIYIEYPTAKDYRVIVKRPFAGSITEVVTRTESGTATVTVKINSTALGGTANSASTSEQAQTHSSDNAFVANDDIVVTVSSISSCIGLSINLKYTRSLA